MWSIADDVEYIDVCTAARMIRDGCPIADVDALLDETKAIVAALRAVIA